MVITVSITWLVNWALPPRVTTADDAGWGRRHPRLRELAARDVALRQTWAAAVAEKAAEAAPKL